MVLFIVRWTDHWQLAFEHLDCSKPIDLLLFSFKRRHGWLWGHWFVVGQWLVFGPSTKLFFAITRSLSFSPGSSVYWTIKQSTPHLSGSTADCSDTVVTLMNDIRICMSDRSKRNARLFLRFLDFWSFTLRSFIGHRVPPPRVLFITKDEAISTFVWCNWIGLVTATAQHYVSGCHSLLKIKLARDGWYAI